MFRLDGKVALITGVATGLSAGISVALARQGADIAISDKPGVCLQETLEAAKPYGHQIFPLDLDVRESNQRCHGINAVISELGCIDILINNAGINRPMAGLEVTEENWDEHYNTNIKGGFFDGPTSRSDDDGKDCRTRNS